jgi:mono/diheme cytochrome c family protein
MKNTLHEAILVTLLVTGLYAFIKYCESNIRYYSNYFTFEKVTQNVELKLSSQAGVGEKVFKANCAVCHGAKGQGASGPQNNDASLELLKAKVLTGSYPPGYKPKRTTRIMPRFPHLKDKIEAIHQYFQEVK